MVRAGISLADPVLRSDMVAKAARYLMLNPDDRMGAAKMAEAEGATRVAQVLRAAMPVGVTGDTDYGGPLSDWHVAANSFFESSKNDSVFFNLLNSGALRRVPLQKRLGAINVGAQASIVGEGLTAPVSRLTSSGLTLPAMKAVAIISLSREVLMLSTPEVDGIVASELRAAVGTAVDGALLGAISVGAATFASLGSDAAGREGDLWRALDAVDVRGSTAKSLVWIGGAGAVKAAAVTDPTHAASPRGGTLLGLPLYVCDAAADGDLYLLNCGGVAAASDTLRLSSSEQTMLELSDSPDSPATANTVHVSAWQANLGCLMATVFFGVKPFQSDICAITTGVQWGASP